MSSVREKIEEFDEEKFQSFWDEPSVDKMRFEDDGELDALIIKHCEVEEV